MISKPPLYWARPIFLLENESPLITCAWIRVQRWYHFKADLFQVESSRTHVHSYKWPVNQLTRYLGT